MRLKDLPLVSIVVPNLNGGATLGRTLDSLLEQAYPRLEIMVVDGGSQDNSLAVIRAYEPHLAWWVSEPDGGQAAAINKGLAHGRGDLAGWLCSDDVLAPGALDHVCRCFAEQPRVDVVAGACEVIDDRRPGPPRRRIFRVRRSCLDLLPAYNGLMQPSCFWRRRLHKREPLLDESLHYAMDVELWCHFRSLGACWYFTPAILSAFRIGAHTKSGSGGAAIAAELDRVYRRYTRDRVPLSFWYRRLRYPFERLLRRDRGVLRLGLLRAVQAVWMLSFMPFYGYRRVRYMSWPA
ncbi:MAG: glycosyltransferase [Lentisphaerae bacterium]|nr:glycosyltransferase [Lentisphaerota bacterium]